MLNVRDTISFPLTRERLRECIFNLSVKKKNHLQFDDTPERAFFPDATKKLRACGRLLGLSYVLAVMVTDTKNMKPILLYVSICQDKTKLKVLQYSVS